MVLYVLSALLLIASNPRKNQVAKKVEQILSLPLPRFLIRRIM